MLPLIASLAKALRLSYANVEEDYQYVLSLNNKLKQDLKLIPDVYINSNEYSIPHILNVSVLGVKPESLLHALEEKEIYISTQTACSSNNTKSRAVYSLTNSEERATSSIRISLSHLTTMDEIETFIKEFKNCVDKLRLR